VCPSAADEAEENHAALRCVVPIKTAFPPLPVERVFFLNFLRTARRINLHVFATRAIHVMTAADAAHRRLKMKTFTIDNETNSITIYATAAEAEAVPDAEYFGSEAALAELAAGWPAARLVEIWNSLTGVAPVRRFKDRATAVSRIWKAIQSLGDALPAAPGEQPEAEPETEASAPAAPQTPDVAPEVAPATNDAPPQTDAPAAAGDEKLLRALARAFAGLTPEQQEEKWVALKTGLATMKPAAPRKATTSGTPREGSKISQVIALLKREGGVSLEEIMTTMEWQQHTARALMSAGGALAKKHGLTVVSTKGENGERTYSLAS
jgi:hypothetical protein